MEEKTMKIPSALFYHKYIIEKDIEKRLGVSQLSSSEHTVILNPDYTSEEEKTKTKEGRRRKGHIAFLHSAM